MRHILNDLLAADPGSATYRKLHTRLLHALDYAEKCQGDIAALKTVVTVAKDAGTVLREVASIVGTVASIAAPFLGDEASVLDITSSHESPITPPPAVTEVTSGHHDAGC